MKLTKTLADAAEYEGRRTASGWSRCVYWDEEVRGFGLRVYPSGRKSFVVSYRLRGRQQLATLGAYGTLTVKQARDRARKMLVDVLDGVDPVVEKREARRAPTLAELAKRYLEVHARPKKRPLSVKTDEGLLKNQTLPRLGRRRVEDISRADVSELHHALRETPIQANRVVALLSKMFNLAEK